jgi:4-hydroxy-tetrahydrodipicolinate reductase
MKIALIGYGKMGKAIEALALAAGHEIIAKIQRGQWDDPNQPWQDAEVAIEFTHPESGAENVTRLLTAGIPVVCGTTGWNDQLAIAEKLCLEKKGKMVVASNFSVGVNLFFQLAQYAGQLLANWPEYRPSLHEIHHTAKVDAPSGTAKTLHALLESGGLRDVPVTWDRKDPAPGTHVLTFASPVDRLILEHEALSREGFAAGALLCAVKLVQASAGVHSVASLLFEKPTLE